MGYDSSEFVRKLIEDQRRAVGTAHPAPPQPPAPLRPALASVAMAAPIAVPAETVGVAAAQMQAEASGDQPALVPPRVHSVEDTGLDAGFISDLMLKTIYFRGTITGGDIAGSLRLPFSGVTEVLLEGLR